MPDPDPLLLDAICATVLYADTFDFPLDRAEVHRDLISVAATPDNTNQAIVALLANGRLALDEGLLVLPGREGLAGLRRTRCARARAMWPSARRMGRLFAHVPYVRMVAVTGSLAADNPDDRADLDYMLITQPGRLWSVRAMAVTLVRLAHRAGIRVCPNYLLSTRALVLDHQDLFTAHELLQLVPLSGPMTYQALQWRNAWTARWLPNRTIRTASPGPQTATAAQHIGEAILRGFPGDGFEAWEASRKQARLNMMESDARFTSDVCEGHFGNSRRRTLHDFEQRCRQLAIRCPLVGEGEERSDREPRAPRPVVLSAL
jgi:hypothetical protein